MTPIKVDRQVFDIQQQKWINFKYSSIPKEDINEGFVDAKKYLPADYDLCSLILEGKNKPLKGWHSGCSWDGAFIDNCSKIIAWKREIND